VTQTILLDSASQKPRNGDPGQQPRGAGERALDCLLAAGFERTEPPILHPAAIFLDMSGEEVRRRLFLTADAAGEELCLRPEYTIPVCRAYLGSDKAGRIAEYSYLGPVFRARAGQGGEQTQTGLESFGRRDAEAADAEVFSLAMEAATAAGGGALAARLGDAGLFEAMLDSLKIPEAWRRRLRRGVARGRSLEAIFAQPSQSALAQPGVLAALESADHAGAKALVEDLLDLAGRDARLGRVAHLLGPPPHPAPVLGDRAHADAVDPGAERRSALEARQESRDLREGFLGRVVEIGRAAEQAIEPRADARQECAQRVARRVRISGSQQQRSLRQSGSPQRNDAMTASI